MPFDVHVQENSRPESRAKLRVERSCKTLAAALLFAAVFRLKYPLARAYVTDDDGDIVPRNDFEETLFANWEGGSN